MIRRTAALAAALALALGASACGSGSPKAGPSGSPPASTSPTLAPYVAVPTGVALTAPGVKLGLGDHAVIAWRPRQNVPAAALDVQVTRIERTTYDKSFQGWSVSAAQAATTPYFVRAVVTNVSDTDLGGLAVPLLAEQDSGTLVAVQPFQKRVFEPCHPYVTPTTFAPGKKIDMCFVYAISPGHDLASVIFAPQNEQNQALAPISWTGHVSTKVQPPAQPKKHAKHKQHKKAKHR